MKKINGDNYERLSKLDPNEKNDAENFLEEVINV